MGSGRRGGSTIDLGALDGGAAGDIPSQISINISVRVPFSRSCLFKRVIESGAAKQVKDQYSEILETVRGALVQYEQDRQPAHLGSPTPAGMLSHRYSASAQNVASLGQHAGGGGPQGLSERGSGGDGHHTPNHPLLSRVMSNSHRNSSLKPVVYTSAGGAHGDALPSHLGGATTPKQQRMSTRMKSKMAGAWRTTSSYMGSMMADMLDDSISASQRGYALLIAALLLLQLLVLFSTWRAARRTASLAQHHRQFPDPASLVANWSPEGLHAASREMWGQRAALLESELTLLQAHMKAVQDQLSLALSHTQ